jgi:serine protease Do
MFSAWVPAAVPLFRLSIRAICPVVWGMALLWIGVEGTVAARPAHAQEVTGLQAALAIEKAMTDAIARAEKSVVAIARVRKQPPEMVREINRADLPRNLDPARLFNRFNPRSDDPTSPDWIPNEYATGVIVDREGTIVTNYHVLGDPRVNDYYVWIQRRPFRVTEVRPIEAVQAGDPWTDLAVLKIAADNLEPITLGDAKSLKKGQIVIALGNPYAIARDGDVSASWGIVSNLARQAPATKAAENDPEVLGKESLHHYGTLIQTDAKLNQGTSGGALINLQGEMVGLITALGAMDGYEKAAGFAIPVDDLFRRTIDTLKEGKKAEFGFLGVGPENLETALRQQGRFGVRISQVVPGTPAANAGLVLGDIITHVDDVPIHDRTVLMRELGKQPVGAVVQLSVERGATFDRPGRSLVRSVKLSKKYVSSSRPAFAQIGDRVWRGMSVDFPTAVLQSLGNPLNGALDPRGSVAAAKVETNSPAWKAGLRTGTIITHVGNDRVTSPDEFFAAVDGRGGDVILRLAGDLTTTVKLPPPMP